MNTNRSFFGIACRLAAFSFLVAGTASLVQAQQSSSVFSAPTTPLFQASAFTPSDLTGTSSSSSSSSSSPDQAAPSYAKLDLGSLADLSNSQPPPRRTYGRPTYNSGFDKYFGFFGFGAAVPLGITHKYETESWGLGGGIGRNFSKTVGVDAEFNYDHFGLQGATLNNQNYIYDYGCPTGTVANGTCGVSGLDGNNHVWSFTVNPIYTLPTDGTLGAYFIVGGGYYHKVTNFTEPSTEEYCYFYCEEYEANANIDHYTSNAFGVNGGVGLTYKFSHFSNERFFVEARYVFMLDSQRTGITSSNIGTSFGANYNGTDFYPANSDRTTYIPIKVGIRF